jgi:Zinc finger, C3HC4 type (RING finger)
MDNKDVMEKFEVLQKHYNNFNLTDTEMNEKDIKTNLQQFGAQISSKMNDLQSINEHITQLVEYKEVLGKLLTEIQTMEKTYQTIFEKYAYLNHSNKHLLLDIPKDINKQFFGFQSADYLKQYCFTIKDEYLTSIFDTINAVDKELKAETAKLHSLNDLICTYRTMVSSLEPNKKILNKYICTVCYDKEISICLSPCGHTFCSVCIKNLKQSCFLCNQAVNHKTQIFLSGSEDESEVVPYQRPTVWSG